PSRPPTFQSLLSVQNLERLQISNGVSMAHSVHRTLFTGSQSLRTSFACNPNKLISINLEASKMTLLSHLV
ncbi:hypothetical protein PIB30_071682, partial [Stylosanthes scabra]|nr:hypothetical protein [Stylosanthes scabra]